MTFTPDERDYEAAKKDPAFARASNADKYRLAFVEQMIRLFGKGANSKAAWARSVNARDKVVIGASGLAGQSGP